MNKINMINEELKYINKIISLSNLGYTVYSEPYYEILDEPVTDSTEILVMDGEENRL